MLTRNLGAVATVALALSVTLGVSGAAHAATRVYDNGAPLGGGLEATQARVADDFTFAETTTVGGAGIYMDGHIDNWTGGFQYEIYSSEEGFPNQLLTSGDVVTHPVDQGKPNEQEIFLFQFDFLKPFVAQAGETYFLVAHARSDFRDNDGIYWAFTNPNGSLGAEFQGAGDEGFTRVGGDMAFFLTGKSSGAPEPAAWALMLSGFALSGAALRARRRAAAA